MIRTSGEYPPCIRLLALALAYPAIKKSITKNASILIHTVSFLAQKFGCRTSRRRTKGSGSTSAALAAPCRVRSASHAAAGT
jgi:hypothetical protein